MTLDALKNRNAIRWQGMVIHLDAVADLDAVAKKLVSNKARYTSVATKTGVPWAVIAVIHEREASGSWAANLAQGDPWDRVSVHEPKGEGPFKSWEEAAIHAVTVDDHLNTWGDWSPGGTLTALEKFNGLGYYNRNVPSPYIWAKTNQYTAGKFIADHVYDSQHVDTQYGCAALLCRMALLDRTADISISVAPIPVKKDSPQALPEKLSLWQDLKRLLKNSL